VVVTAAPESKASRLRAQSLLLRPEPGGGDQLGQAGVAGGGVGQFLPDAAGRAVRAEDGRRGGGLLAHRRGGPLLAHRDTGRDQRVRPVPAEPDLDGDLATGGGHGALVVVDAHGTQACQLFGVEGAVKHVPT
jgi:hypothetical protein